jgi:WhiB family redox-sensing transcriptional regulator
MHPSLFFPRDEDGEEAQEAKHVCSECSVIEECLQSALNAREQYGIWGGMTSLERRRLQRRLRRKSA